MTDKTKCLFSLVLLCLLSSICIKVEAEEVDTSGYALDLGKIVVTPSRIEQVYKYVPNSISIISSEDVATETEFTAVLDLLPSVDILEYGSYGSARSVHTRGAATAQVITLIDGRPTNTPRDGETDYNQIPLSNIERVEVMRGPASSIYGANAVGGVINIITKSGKDRPQTEITQKSGTKSTNFTSFTTGNKIKNFDYFLSYEYLTSHGHRDNADYLSNNINTKLGYSLNDNNRITLATGCNNSEVGSPGQAISPDLDDRTDSFKKYVDLTFNGKFLEDQDVLLKLYYNSDRLEFYEAFDPLDKDAHATKIYGVDAQFSQTFFDILRTTFGANYQDHRLNSSASAKHKYNLKAFYAEGEVDLFDAIACKIGARWDDYSNFGDRTSPSLGVNFWLFDKIKVHSLVAKSFRAPTFNQLYWPLDDWGFPQAWWPEYGRGAQGSPALGPEKALSWEAGISGYFFENLKTDVTFFKTEFEDLIEWAIDSNYWWRPTNVSKAVIQGVEFETQLIAKEKLKLNFNYTYLDTENKTTGKELIYRPHHLFKSNLDYFILDNLILSLNGIYKTRRFDPALNPEKMSPYFVMNLKLRYQINEYWEFLFEAKNMFDRAYEETNGYPMPGRTFYGGMKLTF